MRQPLVFLLISLLWVLAGPASLFGQDQETEEGDAVEVPEGGASGEGEQLIFPGTVLLIDPPSKTDIYAAVPSPSVTLPREALPQPEMVSPEEYGIPRGALEPLEESLAEEAEGADGTSLPVGADLLFGGGSRIHLLLGASLYQFSGDNRFLLDVDFESDSGYWTGKNWGSGQLDSRQFFRLAAEGNRWAAGYELDRRGLMGPEGSVPAVLGDHQRLARHFFHAGLLKNSSEESSLEASVTGGWTAFFLEEKDALKADRDQGLWLEGRARYPLSFLPGEAEVTGDAVVEYGLGGAPLELLQIPWEGHFSWGLRGDKPLSARASVGTAGVVLQGAAWPWSVRLQWLETGVWQAALEGGYLSEALPRWRPYDEPLYILPGEEPRYSGAWQAGGDGFVRLGREVLFDLQERVYIWERRPVTLARDGLWHRGMVAHSADEGWARVTWESLMTLTWNRAALWEASLEWRSLVGPVYKDYAAQSVAGEVRRYLRLPGDTRGGLEVTGTGSYRPDYSVDFPVIGFGGWWNPAEAVEIKLSLEDWFSLWETEGRLFRDQYRQPGFRGTLTVKIIL